MITIELMNQNYQNARNNKDGEVISNLADIQKCTIVSYTKTEHDKESIENFESHLFSDSNVLNNGKKYPNLEEVQSYWHAMKPNIRVYNYEESHTKAA